MYLTNVCVCFIYFKILYKTSMFILGVRAERCEVLSLSSLLEVYRNMSLCLKSLPLKKMLITFNVKALTL